jgi:hypothetical protein
LKKSQKAPERVLFGLTFCWKKLYREWANTSAVKGLVNLFRIILMVLLGLIPSLIFAQEKIFAVPHWHQVYSFQGENDWTEGRTFSVNGGPEKSILFAACWPTALVDVLAYYQVIGQQNMTAVQGEVKAGYDSFADFDDGAHTGLIPAYVYSRFPRLMARKIEIGELGWDSDKKWAFLKACLDREWPVLATIDWVKNRGKIYRHAVVIRGYREDGDTRTAILNDPSGEFFLTGIWDPQKTGEGLALDYEEFRDIRFIVVFPAARMVEADYLIGLATK